MERVTLPVSVQSRPVADFCVFPNKPNGCGRGLAGTGSGGQGGFVHTSCFAHSGNVAGSLREGEEEEKKSQLVFSGTEKV